jgi:hypothetical protein
MHVRRVVTGHDASGKSVFVSDELVEPVTLDLMPGAEWHQLWGADEPPRFPGAGAQPKAPTYFPPVGGYRFAMFTLPAAGQAELPDDLDLAAAVAEIEAKLPGMAEYLEHDNPGMHTTATIDFEIVLDGEMILELDDGAEVALQRGDTVVQNGTRHRWTNRGASPARLGVFICGAHHDTITRQR